MLTRLARHPLITSTVATAIAVGVVIAIAEGAGLHAVGRAFGHLEPGWVVVALLTTLVSMPAYVHAHEAIVALATGGRLVRRLTLEIVLGGFGPFAVSGGFGVDQRALRRLGIDARRALRTVLDLGGLEFLSLVWIAFAFAVCALIDDHSLPRGLIWPWLIAVPVGTAIAVWLSRIERPENVAPARMLLGELEWGLRDVLGIARHPLRARSSWASIVLYWLADMATLYAALRAFGQRPPWESLGLAYATGYLLSRRTLPLGGAGFVEALLTFSLYWTHVPLAPALAGVVLYRAVTFLLAALPALAARARFLTIEDLEHPFEATHSRTDPVPATPTAPAAPGRPEVGE